MIYKRLLIVSHNCLSQTGSNGRTMANLVSGWPKEKIAQLFIHTDIPDFEICERYYCLSDSSVIRSCQNHKPAGCRVVHLHKATPVGKHIRKSKNKIKNSLVFFLRELVWRSSLWNRVELVKWVDEYEPEIILVQAGDAGFLLNLAERISAQYHADIVIYNTEGYYFKTRSYLQDNNFTQIFYPLVNRSFKKAYRSLLEKSKVAIYNCDMLRDDYEDVFHNNGQVIMNASSFTEKPVHTQKERKIIYAGTLSLNRHKSLIEIADTIQKIDARLVLDIYGKCPNQIVEHELNSCKGIQLHGFVEYEDLVKELERAAFLVHVESFDPFYKEDLKYAFSTKIADSLASGACLIVYAPPNMAVSQYLNGKNSSVLINDKSQLESTLRSILSDDNQRKMISENGRRLAEQNHSIDKNRKHFQTLLLN